MAAGSDCVLNFRLCFKFSLLLYLTLYALGFGRLSKSSKSDDLQFLFSILQSHPHFICIFPFPCKNLKILKPGTYLGSVGLPSNSPQSDSVVTRTLPSPHLPPKYRLWDISYGQDGGGLGLYMWCPWPLFASDSDFKARLEAGPCFCWSWCRAAV